MLSKLLDDLGGLHGELTGWHKDKGLDLVQARVYLLDDRDGVGGSFAGPVLSASNNIISLQRHRDGLFLNRRRVLVTLVENSLNVSIHSLTRRTS